MKFRPVQKILVITLSNLGDVVLTLPVFQALVRSFPGAQIDVVAGASGAVVFQNDDRIRNVSVYDKKMSWRQKAAWIAGIRRERYDVIVDLKRSLAGLLGAARFRSRYFVFFPKRMHRAERHLMLVRHLVEAVGEDVSFLKADAASASIRAVPGQRVVAAAPGSKSDIKKWPAESFAKLLDRLAASANCRIVLVGDKQDAANAEAVRNAMRMEALDLTGETDFKELTAVLKAASLVITNDSAPLHIADALKIPVLALFGPTDPRKYGPRFSGSLAARRLIFCSPCERAQCRYEHECLKELSVEEVHKKALKILNDRVRPRGLKILVIRLDRIGDVLLSLPAIEAIRERFPDAFLSVMTRPATKELVEGHPAVDEVIAYRYEKGGRHRFPLGYFRFLWEIVRRKFDIAFVFHPSTRSIPLPFLAGIPYRIGHDTGPISRLLTKRVPDRRREGTKHESDYTLDVARAFGAEAASPVSVIPVFPEDRLKIDGLLNGLHAKPIVAIHPGASCPSKRWPKERFAELTKKILSETGYGIVVIGGVEEKPLAEYLVAETVGAPLVGAHGRAQGPPLRDLTGQLNLKELAALLQKCKALVSNDSGPVHVAAAMGTRSLVLFGRNQAGLSAVRWKPMGEGHRVIQKDVGCAVCLAHRCTIGFECLNAITVDEVFQNLKEMLNE